METFFADEFQCIYEVFVFLPVLELLYCFIVWLDLELIPKSFETAREEKRMRPGRGAGVLLDFTCHVDALREAIDGRFRMQNFGVEEKCVAG